VALALLAITLLGYVGMRRWAAAARSPTTLGMVGGRLTPCPATPNCVGSEDPSAAHRMPPIPLTGWPSEARRRLTALIERRPRARIVAVDSNYVRAEFRSRVFGFIDDVEFRIDLPSHAVHFRSASRLGRGDLGVNRRRMHALATALADGNPGLRH
jgi:uncharacterized protein (DUF1499 family)